MLGKHMTHTHKTAFYPKPLSFSNKLFFEVGNTLILIQPEPEKKIQKAEY